MILKTQRLTLTPTSIEDAAFLMELMNTPAWIQNIGDRNIHHLEDARSYIEQHVLPLIRKLGYGSFIIRLKNGKPIGTCGLYEREGISGLDLGFALLPQFEGHGYAHEAATRLIQESGKWGLSALMAYTNPDNLRSIALLEKLNFMKVGTARIGKDAEDVLAFQLKL